MSNHSNADAICMSGEVSYKSRLILDSEIIKSGFIMILRRKTGVCEVTVNMTPFT